MTPPSTRVAPPSRASSKHLLIDAPFARPRAAAEGAFACLHFLAEFLGDPWGFLCIARYTCV